MTTNPKSIHKLSKNIQSVDVKSSLITSIKVVFILNNTLNCFVTNFKIKKSLQIVFILYWQQSQFYNYRLTNHTKRSSGRWCHLRFNEGVWGRVSGLHFADDADVDITATQRCVGRTQFVEISKRILVSGFASLHPSSSCVSGIIFFSFVVVSELEGKMIFFLLKMKTFLASLGENNNVLFQSLTYFVYFLHKLLKFHTKIGS